MSPSGSTPSLIKLTRNLLVLQHNYKSQGGTVTVTCLQQRHQIPLSHVKVYMGRCLSYIRLYLGWCSQHVTLTSLTLNWKAVKENIVDWSDTKTKGLREAVIEDMQWNFINTNTVKGARIHQKKTDHMHTHYTLSRYVPRALECSTNIGVEENQTRLYYDGILYMYRALRYKRSQTHVLIFDEYLLSPSIFYTLL